jgi:hypothetical protein
MAMRPPDEYQQRAIDDAIAAAAWIRWPLRKRLMWLTLFAIITLAELAGVAVLFGAADGSYVAAGVCAAVGAACMLVGFAVVAFAPEAWVRGVVRMQTPRFEDLSSNRGLGTPPIVPPHESDAAAERRLGRRTEELSQSGKWLAGQLPPSDNGQRQNGTSTADPQSR